MKRKCWDNKLEEFVEMPAEMEAFLQELDGVCQKHGFAIVLSDMDELQVERYTGKNSFWLRHINKAY